MKNLYDIYETDITATPANTVGLGNPMLPTAEEPGTEPLIPTAKAKKEKKKKQVKEGILDNMESTLASGDKVMEFIEWYATQQLYAYPNWNKEEHVKEYIKSVKVENDTIIIDMKNIKGAYSSSDIDFMVLKDPIPKGIKTVKVINCDYKFHISSFDSDINFNIEVYDSSKYLGEVIMSYRKIKDIKIESIKCGKLTINSHTANSIMFKDKNSEILELDLKACPKLEEIYGNLSTLTKAAFPIKYIKYQLCRDNILPWGIDLTINQGHKIITAN